MLDAAVPWSKVELDFCPPHGPLAEPVPSVAIPRTLLAEDERAHGGDRDRDGHGHGSRSSAGARAWTRTRGGGGGAINVPHGRPRASQRFTASL
ncbi:hypothetical protein AURDEDRAFT_165742, partial [Auricularia subglabra TFB-10046 SS5]